MKGCEEFVFLLIAASNAAKSAHNEVVDEWRPERPPVTTLFASLGDRIAGDFVNAGGDVNRRVFSLIEQAMDSDDQKLVTAVATGLIEALVNRASRSEGLWIEMASLMGPRSRHHAEAWLA